MSYEERLLSPFVWCTRCGARRALLGGEVCRICIARPGRLPDHANRPSGRARYRAAGWCRVCGGERDRPDRLTCARCRALQAAASNRHRAAHPPDLPRLYADVRARRAEHIAAGLCGECTAPRDRADRRLCGLCRRRAADRARAQRQRRRADE